MAQMLYELSMFRMSYEKRQKRPNIVTYTAKTQKEAQNLFSNQLSCFVLHVTVHFSPSWRFRCYWF